MNVGGGVVARVDSAQAGIAGHVDIGKLQIARVDGVDLLDEFRGEPETGQVPALLERRVTGNEACQSVTDVHEQLRRDRIDMIVGEASVVAIKVVAYCFVVPDVLGTLQVREVGADVEPLLIRHVMVDPHDVIPIGVLRVLALGVIVGSVDGPGLVGQVPQIGDLPGDRIDLAGGNAIVRYRLAAESSAAGRRNRVGIVDLITRPRGQQIGQIACALRRSRHRFHHPRRRVETPDPLVAVHEECPVVTVVEFWYRNRTADAASPPVQPELRLARGQPEKLVGGEHGVLHEVINLAMHAVGAGLQAHVQRRPSHEARTCVKRCRLHLELFHDTGGRRVGDLRSLHVGRAIHHELVAAGA